MERNVRGPLLVMFLLSNVVDGVNATTSSNQKAPVSARFQEVKSLVTCGLAVTTRCRNGGFRSDYENAYSILLDHISVKVMKNGTSIATFEMSPRATEEVFNSSGQISKEDYDLHR